MHKPLFSALLVTCALLAMLLLWTVGQPALAQTETPAEGTLEEQKLQEEIRQLQIENDQMTDRWRELLDFAPFVTVLVAVVGALITIWKQINETRTQREADRRQRELEDLRRFDTNFATIVQNLGSDSPALQASAAASLMTFLKPRYDEMLDDIFLVLLANLKIEREMIVQDVLTRVFERAIRRKLELQRVDGQPFELDLARTSLRRVNLEDLDFRKVELDIAFADLRGANLVNIKAPRLRGFDVNLEGARLSRANLQEARLNRARCTDAQFHATNLISATFKEATLRGAQFHQAQLQSAHLEQADLTNAEFQEADLNDAFFRGATLPERTLRSITRALNWRNAHFDPDKMERLQALAAEGATVPAGEPGEIGQTRSPQGRTPRPKRDAASPQGQ